MEEQREEREFVDGCREPMEKAAGKGLALSSETETLDGDGAKTVEVLVDSGVSDGNRNGGATEDSNTNSSASDEKQVVANVEKTVCSDNVEVKPVHERRGFEISDDVQRVSKIGNLVDVKMNDETAKSEVKSRNGESSGEEETLNSGGNEVTDVKAKGEVEDNGGACDGETCSVARDNKAGKEKESAKKSEGEMTNQKDENGKAMEIDYVTEEQVEKDNAGNESADSIIFFLNANQKAGNDLQNSMKRGVSMKPIPTDLINEIFSRLPAKSVGKFRSLSKLWCSMLSRADFIELHLSRSGDRPRLLFAVERKGVWRFFSSPQSSSLPPVVAADFHSRLSEDVSRFTCSYASGLFYFRDMWIPRHGTFYVVCNPITGQYVTLPNMDMYRHSRGFLGFDPVEKKLKVLAEANPFSGVRHEVLTLGTGEVSWRKRSTDCPPYSRSLCEGICISGVIYYLISKTPVSVVCFDVRSETFKMVVAECFADPKTTKLINYKGKLGGIECNYGEANGRFTLELRLCVLKDVERHEWSTYVYTLPENKLIDDPSTVSVAGMTAMGEIVLAMDYTCKPYYVFYFNPERNTLQSVEIQGFGADLEALEYRGRVSAFVDHVEHLDVEDFKHSRVKHQCSTCEGHFHVDDSKPLESSNVANQAKRLCSNCEEQEKRERDSERKDR